MKQVAEIQRIVELQIDGIKNHEVSERLKKYLIVPRVEMRFWEYEGLGDNQYPCWIVGEYSIKTGIAYSEYGHGLGAEGRKWGLVYFNEDIFSQDALWLPSLEDLFLQFPPEKYA